MATKKFDAQAWLSTKGNTVSSSCSIKTPDGYSIKAPKRSGGMSDDALIAHVDSLPGSEELTLAEPKGGQVLTGKNSNKVSPAKAAEFLKFTVHGEPEQEEAPLPNGKKGSKKDTVPAV